MDPKQPVLEAFIQRVEAEVVKDADLGPDAWKVKICYYRKFGIGRRYAKGPSIQKLSRQARSAICGKYALDIDYENSMVAFATREAVKLVGEVRFPLMTRFTKYAKIFRELLMELYEVDKDVAKVMISCLLFAAAPMDENPLLWALALEFARCTDLLLRQPCNGNLNTMFSSRPNPRASRLSYLLGSMEDAGVEEVCDHLRAAVPGLLTTTLMFDGVIVYPPEGSEAAVATALADFSDSHGMKVLVKPWETVGAD